MRTTLSDGLNERQALFQGAVDGGWDLFKAIDRKKHFLALLPEKNTTSVTGYSYRRIERLSR
jgi:hypothetical protein